MNIEEQISLFENTDIYVIDQILKHRYAVCDSILDAGSGGGRNLKWFYQNGFEISAVDRDEQSIKDLKQRYPKCSDRFFTASLDALPFKTASFDHVICAAVLHFSESIPVFNNNLSELIRVLKPKGSLLIRMASDIGIEAHILPLGHGVYHLPDGSDRFLLTKYILKQFLQHHPVELLEPLKTTNVSDQRCMSTLVLQKN